ncbi:hypothetical protein Y032_0122g1085 [Ancylostoma ceylanicum]|uniref:Uncharacterized protein n=1 Tax=Ancylostoma ceylanicum TaxID=53326 RepID=A0A016T973_9BILA|nr:hypothetical protein Y032_0122g1085 [Ancylostoma ceylanicum]
MITDVKEEGGEFEVMTLTAMNEEIERSSLGSSKIFRGIFMPVSGPSGADGKTALVYDDVRTGRSFRFILHRKNARKADIYACARCKSRRKYVRIMVHNDAFLCDPASLDHICYMNAVELRDERLKSEQRKHSSLKRPSSEVTHFDEKLLEGGIGVLCPREEIQGAAKSESHSVKAESHSSASPKSPAAAVEESALLLSLNEFVSQTDPIAEVECCCHDYFNSIIITTYCYSLGNMHMHFTMPEFFRIIMAVR